MERDFNTNNKSGKILTFQFLKVFIVASLISLVAQLQATTLPLYVQSLGGNLVLAGIMTSVYMGTSAICKPFVGRLLNRQSRKMLFVLFGVVFAFILSSFGFISSILLIMIVRAVNAPCYSICATASTTMATDYIPNERLIEGLGYYNFSNTIAHAFGSSLALYVINMGADGYKNLFFTCSIMVFVAVLIGSSLKYDDPVLKMREFQEKHPCAVEKSKISYRFKDRVKLLFSTPMVFPCLMQFFILIGSSGVVTYLPTWGKTIGITNIGMFFTMQAVTLAVSRLFVGRITKKIGTRRTLVIGVLCIELSMFTIRYCSALFQVCVLALLLGMGSGLVVPTIHAVVVMLAPQEERGMANSIFQMSNDAGICVCSLILGLFAQMFGIKNVFSFGALFPLMSIVIYLLKVRGQIKELGI